MRGKTVSGMLILLVFCLLPFVFDVHPVSASGTIYIRANGSIDPLTANITTLDGITYYFTDNNYGSLVIERSNIVVDGAGYTLQGPGPTLFGMELVGRSKVTIKNINIDKFHEGIFLNSSSNNIIFGNNITNSEDCGVLLYSLSYNNTVCENNILNSDIGIAVYSSNLSVIMHSTTISGNNIRESECGIYLAFSSGNTLFRNVIVNNMVIIDTQGILLSVSSNNIMFENIIANYRQGIRLSKSNNNKFWHNNLIGNIEQVYVQIIPVSNYWDDGYLSGGNYWSDYTGVDSNHDGIGDTAYVIDANNTDNYPLMGVFSDFKATSEDHVQTICNSTISEFQFNGTAIILNVTGEDGTSGFCRICIPTALINFPYEVYVNGTEVSYNFLPFSNSTHSYLHFTYQHSTREVTIAQGMLTPAVGGIYIPTNKLELKAPYVGLSILLAVAVVTVVYVMKRKRNKD